MPRLCMDVAWLDLDLSMYPSFVSSLYSYAEPGRWIKILGYGRGHVLVKRGPLLCCEGPGCGTEMLHYLSGRWCLDVCRRGLLSRALPLREYYPGLVVAAAPPRDRLLVAAAVVLSWRTRYGSNVRRWMRILFDEVVDEETGEIDLEKAVERAARLPSPQPRRLARLLPALAKALEDLNDPAALRRKLLELSGVGPKTADAILLFTGISSAVAPGDVHLQRFAARVLGLERPRLATKDMCLRGGAWCLGCPLRGSCLQGRIVETYGGAAGLVQTIAYVYGSLGWKSWREDLSRVLERLYTSSGDTSPGR